MRCTPSVIGKLVCHVKTSPALASKPRDARYLDRAGDNAVRIPAPRPDRAPPPKKGTRYTLKDSIGLNPHPETLRDYLSKPTIIQLK